jgi:hypothetical protein
MISSAGSLIDVGQNESWTNEAESPRTDSSIFPLISVESLLSATALPHDKLLFSLSLRNTSGWIPLSTVAKFPKIRSYADTYGLSFVAEAVSDANDSRQAGADEVLHESSSEASNEEGKKGKKVGPPFLGRSKESDLVVDGKGERIRRKDIITKADTAWDRTVYAVCPEARTPFT